MHVNDITWASVSVLIVVIDRVAVKQHSMSAVI